MRCLKMAAAKHAFMSETKRLSKPIAGKILCVCVSVRFGSSMFMSHSEVHPASARSWGNELEGGDCSLAEFTDSMHP